MSLFTPSIPSGSLSAAVPGAVPTKVNAVVVEAERVPPAGLVALQTEGNVTSATPDKRAGKKRKCFFIGLLLTER